MPGQTLAPHGAGRIRERDGRPLAAAVAPAALWQPAIPTCTRMRQGSAGKRGIDGIATDALESTRPAHAAHLFICIGCPGNRLKSGAPVRSASLFRARHCILVDRIRPGPLVSGPLAATLSRGKFRHQRRCTERSQLKLANHVYRVRMRSTRFESSRQQHGITVSARPIGMRARSCRRWPRRVRCLLAVRGSVWRGDRGRRAIGHRLLRVRPPPRTGRSPAAEGRRA